MESKNLGLKKSILMLFVDAVLLGGFWLVNQVRLTGIAFHEWFGIALGMILIQHLVMHWRWVINITRKFFRSRSLIQHVKLMLDAVGFAAFFTIIISGILMSRSVLPALGFEGLHSHSLKMIHVTATHVTIYMIAGHLLLNLKTLFKLVKRLFPRPSKRDIPAHKALQAE